MSVLISQNWSLLEGRRPYGSIRVRPLVKQNETIPTG